MKGDGTKFMQITLVRLTDLLETRLWLFSVRGWLAATHFGLSNFLGLFREAMNCFKPYYWLCFLHDSTSPKLLLVGLSVGVLRRGWALWVVYIYTYGMYIYIYIYIW